MNGLYYFEDIINEIEKNLSGEIDISKLAARANMSVYEFRRIFSFVTKIPISEYIRKRRLSLAALELMNGDMNVTELATRYGYDTPSSFSRAFKEYHGVTPMAIRDGTGQAKMLSKITVDITTGGGKDITYSVIRDTDFNVYGVRAVSPLSDSECCEDVWDVFNSSDVGEKIYSEKTNEIYAVYDNLTDSVNCCIGLRDDMVCEESVHIPRSDWVVFKMNTTDDEVVNGFYKRVLSEWFAAADYRRNTKLPNIEVFPADMDEDGFVWEIRIPVI